MALMLVMVALAVMCIIGAATLSTASVSRSMSSLSGDRLQARMIAEAGLAAAVRHVSATPTWRTTLPNGRWIDGQPMSGGAFTLYGEDGTAADTYSAVTGDGSLSDDPSDPVTLTVVGSFGGARHTVRATLSAASDAKLAVATRLEARNASLIDSYNSSAGAYSPAIAGQAAIASSNDIGRPSVTLRQLARVAGDIHVGPGGTPSSGVQRLDWASIAGSIRALGAEIPIVRPAEPAGMPASAGNQALSGGTRNISGNVHYGDLTLSGTAILNVQGNVNLLIDGDLRIGDDAIIQFGGGGAYGAAVSGTIEVLDHSMVDSYDSSVGLYLGNNSDPNAVVATNRTGVDSILADGGDLKGDALVGVGASPATAITVKAGGSITGRREALTQALVIPAAPAWPANVGPNTGNYDKSGGTCTISANLHCDAFKLNKKAVVRISGHRVIRVNKEVVVDDHARIEILPDSSLRLYVGESCTFTSHAEVNANTGNPSLMTIFCRGSGYEVAIKSHAVVHAVVDAPASWMSIDDHGDFFGVLAATRLLIKNHGGFHHDRNPAIASANPRLPRMPGGSLNVFTRGDVAIGGRARINEAGADPASVAINHLGDGAVDVSGEAVVFANVTAADAAFTARERARFTGRVRAVDVALRDSAVTATDGSGGAANPGILADQSVEMSGSAQLNSTGGSAILAVNRAATAVVYLRDAARLEGQARGGPGGDQDRDIRVNPAAVLRGARGSLASPVSITLPAAPPVTGTPADCRITGSATTTLSTDLTCTDLEIRDNGRLTIDGRVTIVVNGAIRLRDNAQLALNPGARATIWFRGPCELAGDARLNPDGTPSALALHNHGTTPVELRDRARLWAHVISPSADWSVRDQAHLFGSFKGQRLTLSASAQFHHDAAGSMGLRWNE